MPVAAGQLLPAWGGMAVAAAVCTDTWVQPCLFVLCIQSADHRAALHLVGCEVHHGGVCALLYMYM